ncbi:hypothetical protein D3C76_51630 [compost metagenome]
MFFFFGTDRYKPGTVCRVTSVRRGIDKKVVIHQVLGESFWCYDNRPVTHRINRSGKRIIDFDPACVLTPYNVDELEVTNDIPLQDDGWGAKYRRERLIIR